MEEPAHIDLMDELLRNGVGTVFYTTSDPLRRSMIEEMHRRGWIKALVPTVKDGGDQERNPVVTAILPAGILELERLTGVRY